MFKIKTGNVYKHFGKDKEILDFSNYSVKPKCYDDWNKLRAGKMKDETGGIAIEEFVGFLSHKCFCFW